jgi:hypothetical protein
LSEHDGGNEGKAEYAKERVDVSATNRRMLMKVLEMR